MAPAVVSKGLVVAMDWDEKQSRRHAWSICEILA